MSKDITQKFHLFIEATFPYEGSDHEYLFSEYTIEALSKRYKESDTYKFWEGGGANILLYILKMDENGDLQYMYRLDYKQSEGGSFDTEKWESIK